MVEFAAFLGEMHTPFVYQSKRASPTKKAAILIHGFPGTPYEMRPLGSIFAELGFDAYGILLPGFGRQIESLGEQDVNAWLSFLEDIYNRKMQQYDEVALVGFSFGSALLINLVKRLQIKNSPIILIAPFWDAFASFNWLVTLIAKLSWSLILRFAPPIKPYEKSDFNDLTTRNELTRVFNTLDIDDPSIRKQIREVSIPISVLDQVRHIGKEAISGASSLDDRILIIQGDKDEIVPLKKTQILHNKLSNSHLRIITGGTHLMALDGSSLISELRDHIQVFIETDDTPVTTSVLGD